jgi:predicted transcriptional regulator
MNADSGPERFRQLMLDNEPTFVDVFSYVFNMKTHQSETYFTLLDNPKGTVD